MHPQRTIQPPIGMGPPHTLIGRARHAPRRAPPSRRDGGAGMSRCTSRTLALRTLAPHRNVIPIVDPMSSTSSLVRDFFLCFSTTGDYTIQCNRESRRISCFIVDTDKMKQIIYKHARNKKDPVDFFLISLHFAKELATIKSEFGE